MTDTMTMNFNDFAFAGLDDLKFAMQKTSDRVVKLKEEMVNSFRKLWAKFLESIKSNYTVPGLEKRIEGLKNKVNEINSVPIPQVVPTVMPTTEAGFEILQDQIRRLEERVKAILTAHRMIIATEAFFTNFFKAGKGKNYVSAVAVEPVVVAPVVEPVVGIHELEPLPEFMQKVPTEDLPQATMEQVGQAPIVADNNAERSVIEIPFANIIVDEEAKNNNELIVAPQELPVISEVAKEETPEQTVAEVNVEAAQEPEEKILTISEIEQLASEIMAENNRMKAIIESMKKKIETQGDLLSQATAKTAEANAKFNKISVDYRDVIQERDQLISENGQWSSRFDAAEQQHKREVDALNAANAANVISMQTAAERKDALVRSELTKVFAPKMQSTQEGFAK